MSWHAVRTEPRKERGASVFLRQASIEPYVPMASRKVVIRNQVVWRTEMLFPSYIFVNVSNMTMSIWARINGTPGVARALTGAGGASPVTIADEIIEIIRSYTGVDGTIPVGPKRSFFNGQPVVIARGPLAGIDGLFEERGPNRIGVLIRLFARESWTPIPEAWLA